MIYIKTNYNSDLFILFLKINNIFFLKKLTNLLNIKFSEFYYYKSNNKTR